MMSASLRRFGRCGRPLVLSLWLLVLAGPTAMRPDEAAAEAPAKFGFGDCVLIPGDPVVTFCSLVTGTMQTSGGGATAVTRLTYTQVDTVKVDEVIVHEERRTSSEQAVTRGGVVKLANAHARSTTVDGDTSCTSRFHQVSTNGKVRVDRLDITRD